MSKNVVFDRIIAGEDVKEVIIEVSAFIKKQLNAVKKDLLTIGIKDNRLSIEDRSFPAYLTVNDVKSNDEAQKIIDIMKKNKFLGVKYYPNFTHVSGAIG